MRFPSHPGGLAGLTLHVPDLAAALPFLHGVLRTLGYGRTSRGENWVLWARNGAQVLVQQAATPEQAATHAFTDAQYAAGRERTVAFLRECLGRSSGGAS